MTHSFIRITSEGGFLGRFYWGNTGSTGSPGWGQVFWLSDRMVNLLESGSGWAGSIGIFRYMTLRLRP